MKSSYSSNSDTRLASQFGVQQLSSPLEALAQALKHYDDAPRVEAKYKPAFEQLYVAAMAAGMPHAWPAVVAWSRRRLQTITAKGLS